MRFGAWLGLVGMGLVLVVPGGALAGTTVDTPQGHAAEDHVVLTPSAEAQLSRRSAANNAAARAKVATVTGSPDVVGQWGPVVAWPVVAINAALLPNGKVLAYDSMGNLPTEFYTVQDHTRATVWDPSTGSQTDVTLNLGYNIFCSGFGHLATGNMFIAGGNKDPQLNGIVQTHYFNWSTDVWSLGVNMAYARWYPTVTAMGNSEMLITSGGPAIPEVRQTDGTLRQLSNASLALPLYPWFDVAPDGRAFDSGPDQTMRSLDPTGAGAWQIWSSRDSINRSYGSHAMYDVGKVLVAGGGPSTNTADVINVNGATPTVTPTGSMAYGRRQLNLTVLADGTVLATGGNSSGAQLVDLNAGVYAAELWNPATGQWTTLSSMQVTRQYHSTALLLPDGRVLSAGGGICSTCNAIGYLNKNAEIFSPPYLFAKNGSGSLAPRPTVTAAPGTVSEGSQFTVSTPDAASITKVALVKLGAVTHSNNMDQRYVPLSFTAGIGTLTVTAPANVNIAPPGPYMLFIINSAGVPSVAPILNVTDLVPSAAFSVMTVNPVSGSPVAFDGSASSEPGGSISAYTWSFGDGSAATGQTASHVYAAPGRYTVTLTVADALGQSASVSQSVTIAGGGIGSARGTGIGPITVPVVSRLRVSPAVFKAAVRGPSAIVLSRSPSRYRVGGAKVSYSLSRSATVRFTVRERVLGRVGGRGRTARCVAQTNNNRKAPLCTRTVTLRGSFTETGSGGANRFQFTGRLHGQKLKPGTYTLVATPMARGRAGRAVAVAFRIIS
jgi:Domain of unknown function (DUF1929)/PKD domain